MAMKTSSSLARVSFNLRQPEGVPEKSSLILLISYRAIDRSPNSIEFYLNYSHLYSHTFTPFFEGTSTSYLSLVYFRSECLSFNRTEESNPLPSLLMDLAELTTRSVDVKPKGDESSSLNGTFSIFNCGFLPALGLTSTFYPSSELLSPKSFNLPKMASSFRAILYLLYLSRSCLKCLSVGEFDESVLDPSSGCLISSGTGLSAGSSSELESSAIFFFMIFCACCLRALRSARYACRYLLKSLSGGCLVPVSVKLKPVSSCISWIQQYLSSK